MDFERAEYVKPDVLDGRTGYVPGSPRAHFAAFPLALLYGVLAGAVGAAGYALVGMTGFMVSIVTIAIGWLVARSMMTATRGFGGQPYQVAAVLLTYLSASCGRLLDLLYAVSRQGIHPAQLGPAFLLRVALLGPFLRLGDNLVYGLLGLLILFYGLRTAWQMAAGTPGFGQAGGPRMGFMGVR